MLDVFPFSHHSNFVLLLNKENKLVVLSATSVSVNFLVHVSKMK